jgi:hypothetical protein
MKNNVLRGAIARAHMIYSHELGEKWHGCRSCSQRSHAPIEEFVASHTARINTGNGVMGSLEHLEAGMPA